MRFKTEAVGGYDLSGLFLYALIILGIALGVFFLFARAIVRAVKEDKITKAAGVFLFAILIIVPVLIVRSLS